MTFASLGTIDLWDGEITARTVAGQSLLVAKVGDDFLVYEDRCPHLGVPLSEGTLHERTLTCRAHEWQFDIQSGCSINPTGRSLERCPSKLIGDELWVDIEKLVEKLS